MEHETNALLRFYKIGIEEVRENVIKTMSDKSPYSVTTLRKVSCLAKSWYENFMHETFIFIDENEMFMHENVSFAQKLSWMIIPCMK